MALTREQIAELASRHFGDLGPLAVEIAVAIALAESGGDETAIGDNFSSGHQPEGSPYRYDLGLMQINSVHQFGFTELLNPDFNMACARRIYDQQGWGAWATYNADHHLKHLDLDALVERVRQHYRRAVLVAFED